MFVMPYLLCGAICDDETGKIPNFLTASAVFTGLLFSSSVQDFFLKLIMVGILFILGMFGVIGMGDIKLWMGAACLTNLFISCYMVATAIGILLLVLLAKKDTEALKASLHPFRQIVAPSLYNKATTHKIPFGIYMFFGGAVVEILYSITEAVLY